MTHVTCRLTAKNRDQLRNPTLGNRVWATFTFFTGNGLPREPALCQLYRHTFVPYAARGYLVTDMTQCLADLRGVSNGQQRGQVPQTQQARGAKQPKVCWTSQNQPISTNFRSFGGHLVYTLVIPFQSILITVGTACIRSSPNNGEKRIYCFCPTRREH